MRNKYKINGNITKIYTVRSNGENFEIKIDTNDLEKVNKFENTWCVVESKGKHIVRGTCRVNGKKKQILLKQYILEGELKKRRRYNL